MGLLYLIGLKPLHFVLGIKRPNIKAWTWKPGLPAICPSLFLSQGQTESRCTLSIQLSLNGLVRSINISEEWDNEEWVGIQAMATQPGSRCRKSE